METTPRHSRRKPKLSRRTAFLAAAVAVGSAFAGRSRGLELATPSSTNPFHADSQTDERVGKDSNGDVAVAYSQEEAVKDVLPSRSEIISSYIDRKPIYWGLEPPGALIRLPEGETGIAITVDFCGGPGGNGLDLELLSVLRERLVPAVLFLNSRWIAANPEAAGNLASDPLFELASHGTTHRPLSTTGQSAYGIPGTLDAGEVYDEVMMNDAALTLLGGKRPKLFRPGTAYLDDVAAQIVRSLGITPAGFSINGDGGATYPASTVAQEIGKARPGDIVICHGNHPASGTAEGMARALDKLMASGFECVPIR